MTDQELIELLDNTTEAERKSETDAIIAELAEQDQRAIRMSETRREV